MATSDDKVDELEESAAKPKKDRSGLIKILLIAGGATLFLGVNAGITYMLTKSATSQQPAAPAAAGAEAPAPAAEGEHGDPAAEGEGGAVVKPTYFKFDPAFVVNFQAGEELRFLQVQIEVVSRDPAALKALEEHMPVIRNNLIVLFSSQDFTTISTRVGKERIRAQVLSEMQKILREKIGKPGVDEVYFTAFVMQ